MPPTNEPLRAGEKALIEQMLADGKPIYQIAKSIHRSWVTVRNYVNQRESVQKVEKGEIDVTEQNKQSILNQFYTKVASGIKEMKWADSVDRWNFLRLLVGKIEDQRLANSNPQNLFLISIQQNAVEIRRKRLTAVIQSNLPTTSIDTAIESSAIKQDEPIPALPADFNKESD